MLLSRLCVTGLIVAAVHLSEPESARAQDRAPATRDEAVLSVDGVVREIFQSARQNRVDFIVQIEVKRSEALRAPRTPLRVLVPAPGDMVYVHASERPVSALGLGSDRQRPAATLRGWRPAASGRTISGESLPLPQAKRRLGRNRQRLVRIDFEGPGRREPGRPARRPPPKGAGIARARDPRPPLGETPDASSALAALGLTGEAKTVQGKFVVPSLKRRAGRRVAARGSSPATSSSAPTTRPSPASNSSTSSPSKAAA